MEQKESAILFQYYIDNDILPTYASFSTYEQVSRYEQSRYNLMQKLKLNMRTFKGAKIIEFGPDTGENGLIFTKWGGDVLFVEPNFKSHAYIQSNFHKFSFSNHTLKIEKNTLQGFSTTDGFDIVVAEGFLHTIKPHSVWLEKFFDLLVPGGIAIFSYAEEIGSLWDILHKVIYRYAVEKKNENPLNVARQLFQKKWDYIPHTRSFNSWFHDNILNPCLTAQSLIKGEKLLAEAMEFDLSLFSSWPIYEDSTHIMWHKKYESDNDWLTRTKNHIIRSKLSYLFGESCFYTGSLDEANNLSSLCSELIRLLDMQIEHIDTKNFEAIKNILNSIKQILINDKDFYCSNFEGIKLKIDMLYQIFLFLNADNFSNLCHFINNDINFLSTWGMPNHYMVLQKKNLF